MRNVFRTLAILEAFTWAGLLISMLIKYPFDGGGLGVTIFGWLHGTIWIAFLAVGLITGIWFRWRWWLFPVGFVSSVLPFTTVPFDVWMEKSGRLRARGVRR
jgi:integral membrane protein